MRARRRKALFELNIINLVDVVFTLLIIFMITAPMMTQGIQVDLPKAEAQNVEVQSYVQVTIDKRNEVYIGDERIRLLDFKNRFIAVFAGRKEVPVFFSADKSVPYGMAMKVIADIQNAGVVKLGFMTAPPDKAKK